MTDEKKDRDFWGNYTKEELEDILRRRAEKAGMTLEEYKEFQRRRPRIYLSPSML